MMSPRLEKREGRPIVSIKEQILEILLRSSIPVPSPGLRSRGPFRGAFDVELGRWDRSRADCAQGPDVLGSRNGEILCNPADDGRRPRPEPC